MKARTKVRILKNKNGHVIGVKINEQLIQPISEIQVSTSNDVLPEVHLSFPTTDLEFETVDTTKPKLPPGFDHLTLKLTKGDDK